MKHYKWDYEKKYIGDSDIACLILVGGNNEDLGAKGKKLNFGGDSDYYAYIVDDEAEIPERYKLHSSFDKWLQIYDDQGLTMQIHANVINVYRCGDYGCIIQKCNQQK